MFFVSSVFALMTQPVKFDFDVEMLQQVKKKHIKPQPLHLSLLTFISCV